MASVTVTDEDKKHRKIHTHEQFQAVVKFIVDNHHAIKEVKNFSKNFDLTEKDLKDIDKMVEENEPVYIIVHEILQRHHHNTSKHPSLKSIAQIFTSMGLQKLADDIEALWNLVEFEDQDQDTNKN